MSWILHIKQVTYYEGDCKFAIKLYMREVYVYERSYLLYFMSWLLQHHSFLAGLQVLSDLGSRFLNTQGLLIYKHTSYVYVAPAGNEAQVLKSLSCLQIEVIRVFEKNLLAKARFKLLLPIFIVITTTTFILSFSLFF